MDICKSEGCNTKAHGQGYCKKHHARLLYKGQIKHIRAIKAEGCSVEGCTGNHRAKGLCSTHYGRRLRKEAPRSAMYMTWCAIKQRCDNPNHRAFKYYGGRGISSCTHWDSFDNFAKDMGERPSASHSIDRIDNDGNYEPDNCRWATAKQQRANQRPKAFS